MGVGDSSLLNAVDQLSSTLQDLERKLATIEDSHVHLERTVCVDGDFLVCGQKIRCDPNIKLNVGPILGIVTSTSVRILVETDKTANISFNLFLVDEISKEGKYVLTEVEIFCFEEKILQL